MSSVRPLFGGQALAEWVRAGGRPERRITGHGMRLAWQAFWFEVNWRLEERSLAPLPLPQDPVFVLGLWRSGTSVLHELLTLATGWQTPRTWQCFNPSTCFLTGPPGHEAIISRPMDAGLIATSGPQEDEFASLLLGEPSIYRGFIDPRRLGECTSSLWYPRTACIPLRWQSFVRGLHRQAAGRRLILKSPSHSFRVPALRTLFPRGKYLWVGRNLSDVMDSAARMWRAMIEQYGLWACPAGAIETLLLADMLQPCSRALSHLMDEVSPADLLWVDFEELRANPRAVLHRAADFLGMADDAAQVSRRIEEAVRRVVIHPGGHCRPPDLPGLPELQQQMEAARARFSASGARAAG
jgi:hypothetical protein